MLAGRDDQLAAVLDALRAGPQAPGFCEAILGDRGFCKTVLLNEIERRVTAELGWPVLSHQSTPDGDLVESLVHKLPDAATRAWTRTGRFLRDLDKECNRLSQLRGAASGCQADDVPLRPIHPR